jgi:hypothetical protein
MRFGNSSEFLALDTVLPSKIAKVREFSLSINAYGKYRYAS